MAESASHPAPVRARTRIHGLDTARALAVVAMVFGHSAEALLDLTVRAAPGVQTYWIFRGLTAPLFLFVSGWAVVTAISNSRASGPEVLRARLPRVLLLLGLGMWLRWPGWGLDGLLSFDAFVWAHFLGFDALQCIGLALLLCAAALSLVDSPKGRVALMAGLAVALPALGVLLHGQPWMASLPQPFRAALVHSPTSPFPLIPWSGYFFAGALTGLLLPRLRSSWLRVGALAVAGLVLVAVLHTWWRPSLPPHSPVQIFHRLGQVLILCALASAVPAHIAKRLQPVGRSTLVLYVFHIPILYGWSTFAGLGMLWGRVLALGEVALVAASLLLAGMLLAFGLRRGRAWLREVVRGPVNAWRLSLRGASSRRP